MPDAEPEAGPPEQRVGGDFFTAARHGFVRAAAVTMPSAVADPEANTTTVLGLAGECARRGVAVAVFPELCLSGYAIDDLVLADPLLDGVLDGLRRLVEASVQWRTVLVVGAPLAVGNRLYNCAVVVHAGRVLGVAPKSYLPTYREFYERRHFAPGDDQRGRTARLPGLGEVPFGPDLLFRAVDVPGLALHVEVCEDMWVPVPPSAEAALAGATLLANLSGSPITVARADDRHLLCRSASARCLAGYVYAAAGEGESTTDLSWDGQTMIYECGSLLAQTERFPAGPRMSIADLDLDLIRQDRLRQGTFDDNRRTLAQRTEFRCIDVEIGSLATDRELLREVDRFPFVPNDASRLAQDCYEAYNIQVSGLEQRLRAIGHPKIVIGVSGGLDSTHALIVAARAVDRLARPRSDILAFTMPGFATTEHTRSNAERLSRALGVTFDTIDITPAARQLLADLDHPFSRGEPVYDITFENVQAGLRTDYLFRLANQRGGIVLGTGDLSELALGWCTYGVGDQMSHYTVNSGVPKTLIQHVIRWVISTGEFSDEVAQVLQAILDTEISPELVPTAAGGKPQSTQASVGPYELQDFTLYYTLRFGFRPSKIAFLAWHAWRDASGGEWPTGITEADRNAYDLATIRRWLDVFVRRYFANQFKRSAIPNGPKVLAGGSLSPRGDWRMPSDARAASWLADLAQVPDREP